MSDEQTDLGSKPDEEANDADSNTEEEETLYEGENADQSFDWDEESENLGTSDWFNPDPGTHDVTFLDDGRQDTREYDGEEGKEVREVGIFTVEVDGEEKQWSVTKGSTESSLWGQLVKVAKARDGLKGEEITLIRTGTGSDTTYTVQEAADL